MNEQNGLELSAVEKLFDERKDFIIIGLTGKTGSGCSKVADLLSKSFTELQPPVTCDENGEIEKRQYKIIYNYAQNSWEPFVVIHMKYIIFTFVLEEEFEKLQQYAEQTLRISLEVDEETIKEFNQLHNKRLDEKKKVEEKTKTGESVPGDNDIHDFYFKEIPEFYDKFWKNIRKDQYTVLMQELGDNIRASGQAFCKRVYPEKILYLAQRVNMLIKILRRRNIGQDKRVLVVIDALRNPFEATFFKERYSAFYLIAITTENSDRKRRLAKQEMRYSDITRLDDREAPSHKNNIRDFYQIDIQRTVELADIYIENRESSTYNFTKEQLLRYVCLIMHPGLVGPTNIERCMQVAYDAKLNSGCLSRQVGAVISNENYDIISIGWNSAPDGQMPCNLRSLNSLIREDCQDFIGMSEFERENEEFKDFLKEATRNVDFDNLKGRNCAYCFKDAYNSFKKQKNQVNTRAIHAEEMAFIQMAKLGGLSVKGGCLFSTARPCILCSKKAYHTGIRHIFYIDYYPDISGEHIINCGENKIQTHLFHGAIGRAYTQLYNQILPYKDELYMLLDLKFEIDSEKPGKSEK